MRPRASTESSKPNVAREVTRRGPDQGELQTSAPFMLGVLPFCDKLVGSITCSDFCRGKSCNRPAARHHRRVRRRGLHAHRLPLTSMPHDKDAVVRERDEPQRIGSYDSIQARSGSPPDSKSSGRTCSATPACPLLHLAVIDADDEHVCFWKQSGHP
jgi:hypothetical protein